MQNFVADPEKLVILHNIGNTVVTLGEVHKINTISGELFKKEQYYTLQE